MRSDEGRRWIPATEAGIALGVTRQRVYQLVDAGLLVGRKYGSTWLISLGSIEARIDHLRAEEGVKRA